VSKTTKNGLVTFAAFSEAFLPLEASNAADSVVQVRAYLGSLPRYVGVALRELQEIGRNGMRSWYTCITLVLWIEYVVFYIQDCVRSTCELPFTYSPRIILIIVLRTYGIKICHFLPERFRDRSKAPFELLLPNVVLS